MQKILGIAMAAMLIVTAGAARAEAPPLKIGVIMTYSGPFATYGHQADLGIETYIKAHGDTIAGRKIEIIRKDDTGLAPDVSKRVTQELAVRDKVDIIFGGCWSPNAFASAPVVTAAKIPFFIIVAATDGIPAKSPYMVRLSQPVSVPVYTMGMWASEKKGWKVGYSAVVDYVLGTAGANAFRAGMTAGGGKVIGEVRIPVSNPDFTPYVQRIKQAHPQVVQLFMPAGSLAEGFVKAYHDIGLMKDGINIVTGPLSETQPTETLGDYVEGIYTAGNWIEDNNSPANQEFLKAFRAAVGADAHPGFVAMDIWDALNITRQVVEEQHGKVDPDKTMSLLRGHQFTAPRGPIAFDQNGEIVQNVYLQQAVKENGKMVMKTVETLPMVKAPALTQ
ncbi:MAG TPA: ABC transporter substrate-binding protein [Stellaceae bacterium]|jgi:branched-chain amino acid transport system substrate-binding protein|nr:ABC transporter substrate-binding protein [Stellaceae bacterium]